MTLVETTSSPRTDHLGEMLLRRFRAGELSAAQCEHTDRHLAECTPCRTKLRLLVEEQRAFERDIPFERFAGGVERARRVPRPRPRALWWAGLAGALAAAAVVLVLVRPTPSGSNGIKGASVEATVRVAPAAGTPQRALPPGSQDVLAPGERVRLGYRIAEPRYLAAVSVDERGETTLLYPESGPALRAEATVETTYLPDSVELTGSGHEKLLLFVARSPFDGESAKRAVQASLAQVHGNLLSLPNPTFAGGQQVFSWLFRKP